MYFRNFFFKTTMRAFICQTLSYFLDHQTKTDGILEISVPSSHFVERKVMRNVNVMVCGFKFVSF